MKIIIDLPDSDYEFIKELQVVYIGRASTKTIQKHVINAIKFGRVIPTDICSCWEEYPNKNHKFKNGKWKCVDCYKNIDNAEGYKRKTHCRRIKINERNTIPGNDTSEPEDKEEQSTDRL